MPESPMRIAGVDAARGLAVLGMLWAHMAPDGTDQGLADGRSSVLFAVLAGISIGLLTGRERPPSSPGDRWRAVAAVAVRGLLLIVIGRLLWAVQTPIAVILDSYGALFVVLAPLVLAPRRVIAVVAALAATLGAAAVASAGADLQGPFTRRSPTALPGEWFLTGYYPGAVWAAYIAIGLLCARSGLGRARVQTWMLSGGVAAAVVGYGGAALTGSDASAHSDTTWDVLGAGGTALAVVGLALLLLRFEPLRRLALPLRAVGGMPLSVYSGQILVLGVVLAAGTEGIAHWWLLLGIAIGAALFAVAWRATVGRGPLESVLAAVPRLLRLTPHTLTG